MTNQDTAMYLARTDEGAETADSFRGLTQSDYMMQ